MSKKYSNYVIGIDEAGRGPLAGPLALGLAAVPHTFDMSLIKEARDSKTISGDKREQWLTYMDELQTAGLLYKVTLVGNQYIDTHGLRHSLNKGIQRLLREFESSTCRVLLDGSLWAPKEFLDQETIIKGDSIEPLISCAAIAAKVKRDKRMIRYAKKFPEYGFERHKGYGTTMHRKIIDEIGPSVIHRQSFLGD